MRLRSKLGVLLRRRKLDAEMCEEMRLHLELLAERKIAAGMDPAEARDAARREFGGVEQIKEVVRAQRGVLWVEESWKDLGFAVRMLRKHAPFTFVAVVSLAIGIGLNTAVFSIINTVFFQSIRGVPQPERVLFFNGPRISVDAFQRLQGDVTTARLTAASGLEAAVVFGSDEEVRRIGLVATNYFEVLAVQPARGRVFAASVSREDSVLPEAVLNESFWRTQLNGDPAIVGTVIRINGAAFTVVGVAARNFHGPGPEGPALWVPLGARALIAPASTNAFAKDLAVFGRLNPDASLAQTQAIANLVMERSPGLFGEQQPLYLSAGREEWRGAVSAEKRIEFLLVTTVPLVIAAGLLWIACSNVGNLLLARAVQRKKEIAIRVASGASRGRLVRMLMAESLVLALLGGVAGLWISGVTLDFVFATLGDYGAFSVQLDGRVLAYTAAISVAAALLFGLVPAWQASKSDVNQALKGESGSAAFRSSRLRAFFLVTQLASSFALLVVAGTFVKSLIAEAYVGTRARAMDRLIFAELHVPPFAGEPKETYHRLLKERLTALPGVEAVTLMEASVRKMAFAHDAALPGGAEPTSEVAVKRIDGDFFRVTGAALVRGSLPQGMTAEAGPGAVAINVAMARRFGGMEAAVDRRFRLGENECRVTGVVRDGENEPLVYTALPMADVVPQTALVRVEGRAEDSVAAVRDTLRSLTPADAPPRVAPLRDVAFRMLGQLTRLALFVGLLALALAAAGLHASMAFSTSQRTQEIGMRMALGATRGAVLRLVLRGGLKIVGAGCALGLIGALIGLRLLFTLLNGGGGIDAVAIFAVMVFFAGVATAACLQPAVRATRVDPMVALRAE